MAPSEPEPDQPQEISLDELAEAFAQAMGRNAAAESTAAEMPATAEETPAAEEGDADRRAECADYSADGTRRVPATLPHTEGAGYVAEPPDHTAQQADADDPCPLSPRAILEAMLFVGNREGQPLTARRAAELMRGVEPGEVPGLVAELNTRYAEHARPYQVISEAGGYRLALRKALHPLRNRFFGRIREARLSQAAIDILSIIAYQQPLSGDQISRLRGKPSNQLLAQLVHRGLLRIEREPGKRRTALYYTTDRFLNLFGLEDLADLPQSEDLER